MGTEVAPLKHQLMSDSVFLPASDIPRFVGEGNVALGITGQDMIAEANVEHLVTEVLPLGFGKCRLQIQTPERGPLQNVANLGGKTIGTSFDVLAGKFFKDQDTQRGDGRETKVEYLDGSVEAACTLGVADAIVDLVESGETMRAAGLHAIHTLMTSEAVLIQSNKKVQNDDHEQLIKKIISRIKGVMAAKKYVLCNYNIERKYLDAAVKFTPGRRAPTVSPLEDEGWVAVSSMVERKQLAESMDGLENSGAHDILVIALDNCRV